MTYNTPLEFVEPPPRLFDQFGVIIYSFYKFNLIINLNIL